MKTKFTAKELLNKGFRLIKEDGSRYLEYVFNNEDYFNSTFLTTQNVLVRDLLKAEFSVTNGVYNEDEPQQLTEEEIDYLIKTYTV
jgi:hypothetical protein